MAQIAPPAPRRAPAHPAPRGEQRRAAAAPRHRVFTVPPVWRELLLIVLFYTGYSLTRIVLVQDGTAPAFAHADQILRLEGALGIDVELSLNQALLEVPWLARAANFFYATMHFAVTLGMVVWLYLRRPRDYRWLRTSLMIATGAAVLGFWLFPLAPPRFLSEAGFVDPVTALQSFGLYASDASATMTNQYAAMPSMHAGWALWCGFVLVRLTSRWWLKALGVLYPTTTTLVIIATANHYVLDAVAGFGVVAGALALSWLLYVRRPRPLLDGADRLVRRFSPGAVAVPAPRPAPADRPEPVAAGRSA
ncbi:phosphatase PAP2 family protein [Actinomadura sp. CNU-125]|uniref:phosphatase PAP2 family protein n=1 Tax=Actinomadura sp. CNU-125 TaxID=1904961 RepID=UPI0021CC5F6B|nr:phosphatase PAP2 family protein [Actinomadura sp. CNU-125]